MVKSTLLVLLLSMVIKAIISEEHLNNNTDTEPKGPESITDSVQELEEKMATLNKAKLIGCIRLARSRLHFEKDKVNQLIEIAGTEKVISTLLINCYSKVSIEQATDFVSKEKHEQIDSLSPENVALLDLEKWSELYKKNDKELRINKMLNGYNNWYNNLSDDEKSNYNSSKSKGIIEFSKSNIEKRVETILNDENIYNKSQFWIKQKSYDFYHCLIN